MNILLYFLLTLSVSFQDPSDHLYFVEQSKVLFHSDAPLEKIEAQSIKLKGAIDIRKNTFAFSIGIESFYGFNSALQREHFNENYMESRLFPEATFTGKIIEDVDLSKTGEYIVRAKGMLDVHGAQKERIIKCKVVSEKDIIFTNSYFTILLADHDISIPWVVHQNIAEEIQVFIDAEFVKKEPN